MQHPGHSKWVEKIVHLLGDRNLIWICLIINIVVCPLEILGGHSSGSLSLSSDGWHMTTHLVILTLALWADTNKKHLRLAVMSNGIFLIGLSVYMLSMAIYRYFAPLEILSGRMFTIACIGLGADWIQNIFLHHPAEDGHSLNIESVFEHNRSDLYLSLCVVLGSISIFIANQFPIFPGFFIDILLLVGFAPLVFLNGLKLIGKLNKIGKKK